VSSHENKASNPESSSNIASFQNTIHTCWPCRIRGGGVRGMGERDSSQQSDQLRSSSCSAHASRQLPGTGRLIYTITMAVQVRSDTEATLLPSHKKRRGPSGCVHSQVDVPPPTLSCSRVPYQRQCVLGFYLFGNKTLSFPSLQSDKSKSTITRPCVSHGGDTRLATTP
jgi:hypothetical protein